MKKILLIGKYDDVAREIKNSLAGEYLVRLCSAEQDFIKGMLEAEPHDLIIVSLSGSAVFAREMFSFLRTYQIPILGLGSESDEAELFINSLLTDSNVRFLRKPAKMEDILKYVRILNGEEEEQNAHEVSGDTGKDVGQAGNATILLIDDSRGFVRFMHTILSKKYKVTFATSAAQAFVSIGRNKPDLILLDYEMPICDGRKMLQMLRAEEDMKDIPVVFLTGISGASHVSKVVELHPEGYLLKPCSEETVFDMIAKVLRERGK